MDLYHSADYQNDLCTAIGSVPKISRLNGCSVMITGAAGLIGSFLVDMLLKYNRSADMAVDIYALGRNLERLEKRFEKVKTERLHLVEHDVNFPPSFDFQVDYVIHAAGNAYPAAFVNDPVGTILGNVLGTNYLLEYARLHDAKRFLFVSSGEVYGQGDPNLQAFPEHYSGYVDPTHSRSCYPSSKRTAETLCVAYMKQYALDTVIARPCHIYGPNATKSDNRASVQFINNAIEGQDIIMKSRGMQMRSYCYVADCASALLTVLLHGQSGEAYNIANPSARVTISGLAETVARVVGRRVVFEKPDESAKAQQSEISYAVLDSTKLCGLGWTGKYSVEQGVISTIRALQNTEK